MTQRRAYYNKRNQNLKLYWLSKTNPFHDVSMSQCDDRANAKNRSHGDTEWKTNLKGKMLFELVIQQKEINTELR